MEIWAIMRKTLVITETGWGLPTVEFSEPVVIGFRESKEEAEFYAELFEEQSQEDGAPHVYWAERAEESDDESIVMMRSAWQRGQAGREE